jgi:hypothetical protein
MVHTATRSIDFKDLAKRLYRHLLLDAIAQRHLVIIKGNRSSQDKETSPQTEPVNCFLEEGVLMVIIHLAETPALETTAIFSCTREFLEKVGITVDYPIKIYLVVDEAANHSSHHENTVSPPLTASFPQRALSQSLATIASDSTPNPPPDWADFGQNQWQYFFNKRPAFLVDNLKWILLGLGLGGSVLFVGIYALSRPCVIGACVQLREAEQLMQASLFSANEDSATYWLTAKQQLGEAQKQLETIPFWSPYYGQVTQLQKDYQVRIPSVELLSQATKQAQQAQLLEQNNALSTTEWQQVKQHWETAIALLGQLPRDSPYQAYAQQKRQVYRQNLLTAQQRLLEEQQAELHFSQATESAVLARIRSSSPKSLADLSLIAATWQEVIKNLQQISPGTTVYEKVLKQLPIYRLEYKQVVIRRQQEEKAFLNYQQALALAKFAEQSELEQQWSIAVTHWQKALMALKQIPPHSFLMEQVRPLLTTYNLALQQAQNRLKISLRSQNIKRDLEALCSQWNRACDYSISPQVIKVRLTSNYVQQIWDSALQAKSQGNVPGQAGVLNHISQLEQTFQTISNQAGSPLEVYHAKGNRLTRYQPIR